MEASRYLFRISLIVFLFFTPADIYSSCIGPSPPVFPGSGGVIKPVKFLNFVKDNNFDLLNLEEEPEFNSAFQLDGSGITQIGGIKEDNDGFMYITGGFTDSLTFNTSPAPTVIVSSGGYNVFLAKYDASGNCLWVRTARGDNTTPDSLSINGSISIAVDSAGNSYIGGGFVRTLSFIDAQNNITAKLTSADTTIYNFEFFVAKYNTNGDLLWTQGGMSGSHGSAADLINGVNGVTSIILDVEGFPYIGGKFSGSDFLGIDVGLEEDGDFFLAALDPDSGEPVWGWILGTQGEDAVMSLSMDVYGYINALGYMGEGVITFPTVPETDLININANSSNTFVAKFDVNGECLWADLIGGTELIYPQDVSTDTLGNIYISGAFKGNASFGPDINLTATGSLNDGFVAKYDFNGYCLWAKRFGGDVYAAGGRIAADETGNTFVFSTFQNNIVFGNESQQTDSLTAAYIGMVVANYDSAGNFQWVRTLDGTGWGGVTQITSEYCEVINNPLQISYSGNSGGRLLLSGDFNNQLFLDNFTLTAPGDARNSFVARLSLSNATAVSKSDKLPVSFSLSQNYPNPFNPSTIIEYAIPKAENVKLKIYDSIGREVASLVDESKSAGQHNVTFNASGLASGIYFYKINAGTFSQVKKLVLVK